VSMSSGVVCPFYNEQRAGHMRMPLNGFCDNLRSGVPLCVVSGLSEELEDWDEDFERASMVMGRAELEYYFPEQFVEVEYCDSVVRSDAYDVAHPQFRKSACFFGGGLCVRPMILGFGGCSADCSRWKDASE